MKTQAEVRKAFWQGSETLKAQFKRGKEQNEYNATIRSEWVEFVDMLVREGVITEALAEKVTL